MRIAAIYDVHGNLPALKTVLQEIAADQGDVIVVGGDVVAGPLPQATLALLQETSKQVPIHFIHGNAESELLRYVAGKRIGGLSPRADEEAKWVETQLSSDEIEFIAGWSATVTIEVEGLGSVLFCHATPEDDITVFTAETAVSKLTPIFEKVTADIVVCGHTHMQFDRMIGEVRVVNAGSVGLPFGHTGADWLLIGDAVEFKHTDYNLEEAAQRIRESNYPHAESFAENNVLQAPAKKVAMEMLNHLQDLQGEL